MSFLRPAFVRLFGRRPPVVKIHKTAALVPEGYLRQIGLTFQMPDPNKGGQNPPLRDVTVLFNPNDARAIAAQLLADAAETDRLNQEDREGGRYTGEYADVMTPDPAPGFTRRVPKLHTWGRLYLASTEFVEAEAVEVTETEVVFATIGGERVASVLRTDTALAAFVTENDDNWETL